MATAVLKPADTFPVGTSVTARPLSQFTMAAPPTPGSAPPGSADDTASVAADGTLTFNALDTAAASYVASAQVGGVWKHLRFRSVGGGSSFYELQSNKGQPGGYPDSARLPFNAKDYGALGDGVADDTAELQTALDVANSAGGGTVFVPDGTYLISTALTIGSNTTLELAPRATVKRNAAIDNMLRNKSDGATGLYGQATTIEVRGGTWDANGTNFASNTCALAFGHAKYVRVIGTTIKDVYGWHFIEFNACQHALARDCTFRDFDATTTQKEMVQLDLALDSGVFPWFGPYDNTPCDDVLVEGCTFTNGCRAVGSHATALGFPHTNVRLIGNHCDQFREEAFRLYEYSGVTVSGNTFNNCWKAIYASADTHTTLDYSIVGNVIDAESRATSRGIQFNGTDVTNRRTRDIVVSGNVVRNCASHGIGIDYSQDVTVSGNVLRSNGGNGIWIYQTTKASVQSNISRNTGWDIIVGNNTGALTDTTDVLVGGNACASLWIVDFSSRVTVQGNVIDTTYSVTGSPADVQELNNFIGGKLQTIADLGRVPIHMTGPPNVLTAGTWSLAYQSTAINTTVAFNNSNAQNDEWRWWVPLYAGTWRLDFSGYKGADGAIITWDISYDNGSTWTAIGTTDLYAAAGAVSTASFTGIVVPRMRQTALLRARALTRNASNTTGWFMRMSALGFTRTA